MFFQSDTYYCFSIPSELAKNLAIMVSIVDVAEFACANNFVKPCVLYACNWCVTVRTLFYRYLPLKSLTVFNNLLYQIPIMIFCSFFVAYPYSVTSGCISGYPKK